MLVLIMKLCVFMERASVVFGSLYWWKAKRKCLLRSIAYVFIKDMLFRLCNRWLKPKDGLWGNIAVLMCTNLHLSLLNVL